MNFALHFSATKKRATMTISGVSAGTRRILVDQQRPIKTLLTSEGHNAEQSTCRIDFFEKKNCRILARTSLMDDSDRNHPDENIYIYRWCANVAFPRQSPHCSSGGGGGSLGKRRRVGIASLRGWSGPHTAERTFALSPAPFHVLVSHTLVRRPASTDRPVFIGMSSWQHL